MGSVVINSGNTLKINIIVQIPIKMGKNPKCIELDIKIKKVSRQN